jgi:hypothetical protein
LLPGGGIPAFDDMMFEDRKSLLLTVMS